MVLFKHMLHHLNSKDKKVAWSLLLILLLAVAGYLIYRNNTVVNVSAITTYEECAAAGYPIMETYPEQCRTPDGLSFTRKIEEPITPITNECNADAKACPDGTFIGRTGPRCEFICPSSSVSGIQGVVTIGPLCPVVREGEECPDKPYSVDLIVTNEGGTRIIKEFTSAEDGSFKFNIVPGTYKITNKTSSVLPRCDTGPIVVTKNAFTTQNISCDSGIR